MISKGITYAHTVSGKMKCNLYSWRVQLRARGPGPGGRNAPAGKCGMTQMEIN